MNSILGSHFCQQLNLHGIYEKLDYTLVYAMFFNVNLWGYVS